MKLHTKSIFKLIFITLLTLGFPISKTFIACEGHFYGGSGSITVINNDDEIYSIEDLGNTVQSLKIYNDKMFVAVNGSSLIHVYEINESEEVLLATIDTGYSGPREMAVHNDYLYFTNWYSNSIKYMSLNTFEIEGDIPVNGLPEDIISDDDYIWVTINMNLDWSDGDKVLRIDTSNNEIVEYVVGYGPRSLLLHNDDIYISRTYYDENWNSFHGTSKINNNGLVENMDYGSGIACGGSIMIYNNQVYRSFNGGIAPLDDNLNIQESLRIGDYDYWNVYDIKTINNSIYIAITDWESLNQVAILNPAGDEVGLYDTGIIPTDFGVWNTCTANGDYNQDNYINVIDIISIVDIILLNGQSVELCRIDMDHNQLIDILDIMIIADYILN